MDPNQAFGAWVKHRRRSLALTQQELAQRVACSIVTVRKVESGHLRPSKALAQKLAEALDIRPGEVAAFIHFARNDRASGEPASPSPAIPLPLKPSPPATPGEAAPSHLPTPLTSFIGGEDQTTAAGGLSARPSVRLPTLTGRFSGPEAQSGAPSLLRRIGRGALIGRERELAQADMELRSALAGESRVLVVSGEPGVGKTRLAHEILLEMQGVGGITLAAACYAEGDLPYAPVSRIVCESFPRAASLDLPDAVLADLIALAPALRTQYPAIRANRAHDPLVEQQRLFESVGAWCEALTVRAPLLLFVDDLHWADSGTLSLLRHLARQARHLRLLLVLTLHESEVGQLSLLGQVLHDLNRERLATHLKLARLGRAESYALLTSLFGQEMTPEFLDAVYGRTDGNAFFIEEVCKSLVDEGQLVYRAGQWYASSMAEIKIPHTVRAAIQARVARVSEAAQEALHLAALLGREFDFETLLAAGDLDEEALIGALIEALRAQLVAEVPAGEAADQRFSFAHVLIPTTLRENAGQLRLRRLHRRVAAALEALHPNDYEALAHHYAGAGDAGRAREYFARAGDRAQVWAVEDAAHLYRAALKHWPDVDAPERVALLGKLGYCLWITADLAGALECYETAYRLFDRLGMRAQGAEMQRRIGGIYWEQADQAEALRRLYQALAILEQGLETPEHARAMAMISQNHMLRFQPDEAIAWGERALAMAERLRAEDVIVYALNNLGSTHCFAGNWDIGLPLLEQSVQRALALESPNDVCRGYYNTGVALQHRCRYDEAIDFFDRLLVYARKTASRTYVTLAVFRLAWANWDTGRWGAAFVARSQLSDVHGTRYLAWTRRLFAAMDVDLDRIEMARQELQETVAGAMRADDFQTTVPHLGQLIRVYAATRQAAEAAGAIGTLLDCLERRPYPFADCIMALLFACHWLAGHDVPEASEMARRCLSHLERLERALRTEESRAALAEARGCLRLGQGDAHAAVGPLRQASGGWETLARRYDQARALDLLGRALVVAGNLAGARAAGAQGLAITAALATQLDEALGAQFLASPLVEDLRQVAASSPGATSNGPAGLTDREIEVLRLVAQGLTNGQIAEQLVVSPLTVNAHLRSIFNKLGVTRRSAATRFAVEHGLA